MDAIDAIDAAESFLWRNGRLLERLRFEHLFRDGDPDAVIDALRPYQRSDGGFGNALEPDFRGPISQPTTADSALRVLDEVGRMPADLVGPLCDWLTTVTTAEGGVPMVLPSAAAYPRAPWWDPPEDQRASLLPTSGLAGHLHRHGVDHPWREPATEFTWRALDEVPKRVAAGDWLLQLGYDVRCALVFLDAVPDRQRAEAVAAELGELLVAKGVIALDPATEGEVAMPLDFAATPDTLARRWFDDATIEAHLDALAAGQASDGGWTVEWEAWVPAAGLEWRGWQTVERLKTLRAYGRL
jgi:hypothetical protein